MNDLKNIHKFCVKICWFCYDFVYFLLVMFFCVAFIHYTFSIVPTSIDKA